MRDADAAPPPPMGTFSFVGTPQPAARDAAPIDESRVYLETPPVRGKSIGHTSVVFKLELANGAKVAWKPHSRRGPNRYKGEIAAYALGKALGIPNVPAAYYRELDANEVGIAVAADEGSRKLFQEQAIVENGKVRGAAMPWIDKLEFIPFEKDPWWSKWRAWLKKDTPIPEDQKGIARQASIMVAFDYVTANWDRMSGANVGFDKEKNMLLFMDNDGAFFEKPPKDGLERNKALLRGTDRFSKTFVSALRDVDLSKLDLSEVARGGVRTRIVEVLEHVDAKVKANGAAETLYFP